ncbi:uncharacterized protein [Clytia hemisphaerica]|uniref:Kinesin motor domain-containing protein n=1 Tax=Clytia hemisphaerica TaxID=252671 RepID=A0A7M5XGV1_9CNID
MSSKKSSDRSKLNVYVRCRPHLQQDLSQYSTLSFPSRQEVIVNDETKELNFKFDHVFPSDASFKEMFDVTVEPLVTSFLSGVSSSLMAYGQVSTGKTFNMLTGNIGLVHQGIEHIFTSIQQCNKYSYKIVFSFLQIYQDRIYDLLTQQDRNSNLHLREHPKEGIIVEGLSEQIIENFTEADKLLALGKERFVVSENTKTLQLQSRSHVICIVKMEKSKKQTSESPSEKTKTKRIRSKLFLCDLAGSERLNKSGVSRRHIEEARYINTSLLEFGNVIHALTSRSSLYVPFRNSTLTRILKESLGGNSKASLMVCVSPALNDLLETKYSLNFGQRAMKVVKQASPNVEIDYRKLAEYLTSKLKDLEVAYNKEKENLRHLKRKLSKKRSDFLKNVTSESESGGDSNESTPSKVLTTRRLSILLEESTTLDIGLANPALDTSPNPMTSSQEPQFFSKSVLTTEVQTHISGLDNKVKSEATQTLLNEQKSCHTSTTCLLDNRCHDKSINTSVQSLHGDMVSKTTSMHSILSNQAVISRSVNTSVQSFEAFTEREEKSLVNRSTDTLSLNRVESVKSFDRSTSMGSIQVDQTMKEDFVTLERSTSMDGQILIKQVIVKTDFQALERSSSMEVNPECFPSENSLMKKTETFDKSTSIGSLASLSEHPKERKSVELKLELAPQSMEVPKQNCLVISPVAIHEFIESPTNTNQEDEPNHVTSNEPIESNLLITATNSDLSLVNYRCTDADSEISLREAKILQSPREIDAVDCAIPKNFYVGSNPVSPISQFPFMSFESEVEHIYREDTRYARKSLVKARNRYSALLQQLELLTSEDFTIQDGGQSSAGSSNSECHDIVLKFKTELEEELRKAKEKLQGSPTKSQSYAFGTATRTNKDSTVIDCVEGERVLGCPQDVSSLHKQQLLSGSSESEYSDKTPSGVFGEDLVQRSREINNNEGEMLMISRSPTEGSNEAPSEMKGAISLEFENVATFEEDKKLSKQDEKFKKQQKLTMAAIENAEIKKELLMTKLEKLRLEAVLSCVLIDTETNDMTKEFQQLSMRSMKLLTSSKSTLASTTSCAHLPSISSPGSTFKHLQSPKKRFNYKERFVGGDHVINDVKYAGKVSLPDEASSGCTRSVQTEQNVVDWLNNDHVQKKLVHEESSCQSSSDFDVSSISDLGSPLLLTRRMSPCGQDDASPFCPGDFMYDTNFDEVDKLLMQYKKKKPSSSNSAFSCFPFLRNKSKQRMRNTLQNRPSETIEFSKFHPDC